MLLVWLALGVQRIGPAELAVADGPLGTGPRRIDGSWTLAPPGLIRLTRYPLTGVELPLPGAEAAALQTSDGSRYGFLGWATLRIREDEWRSVHRSSNRRGVAGALLDAVRSAGDLVDGGAQVGAVDAAFAGRFEAALGEALSERGLVLRELALESVERLSVSIAEADDDTGARLLVVGLDGADWEILDGLIAEGRLPHLAGLIEDGARAKLLSIRPLLSPVVWTSVATGVEPGRHGILDFVVSDADGGSRQPVTSAQRKVPTFWELLSRRGVDVGVVGWWASWPADPVRGYLVSDRIAYQLFGFRADPADARGKTWPPELYEEIRPRIVAPDSVGWEDVLPYLAGERKENAAFSSEERGLLEEFRTLLASGESYRSIALALRDEFRPRLEVVYFEGTDTIGHLFMPFRLPALPGVDSESIASFSDMVDRYYETADAILGELLAGRDESWTVMVVSDHGFASDATRPRGTDSRIGHGAAADWHRRFGVLILSGAHIRSGVRLDEAGVYDVAPTILALFGHPVPRSWPGRVLADALTPEFLAENPVAYTDEEPERSAPGTLDDDPAAADLLAKLESLGYVSGAPRGEGGGSEGTSGTASRGFSAHNNAGVALMGEGRFADAEAEFRAGLEAEPGEPMLVLNLGLALRRQGRNVEARERLQEASRFSATARAARHQLAMLAIERGELDAAESILRDALADEPTASELHEALGQVLEERGDLAGAARSYTRAADLDPDNALARNGLGNLAKRASRLEEAESWYLKAIEADPYFMGAYNNLALVYQTQGRMDRAIDLYRRALEKSPENAVVHNNLASLHYAQGDRDEARRLWQRSTELDPSYVSPLNNLAGIAIGAGQLEKAESLLGRALELDPGYGDARMNLAVILRARGDDRAARMELERATEDRRSGAGPWLQLGLLELETGEAHRAVAALESGHRLSPGRADVLNALGEAYLRDGRVTEAKRAWGRSLELDPGQVRVREALGRLQ